MTPRARAGTIRLRAFTLLEVMVAVGILGLALTALYSSEVGAVKAAVRARNLTVATMLARCKVAEIEEQVMREGLPAIEDHGRDGCCEDLEQDGFQCEWRIERVELPDEPPTEVAGEEDEEGSSADAFGGGDEGAPSVDQLLAGGTDGLTQMAFVFAYPTLKPALEEQVRRATVVVSWKEGRRERSFDVVRYLVGAAPADAAAQEAERSALEVE